MIHRFEGKKKNELNNNNGDNGEFDFSNVIVKKPWGYEYLVFENESVAIWMLHIVRKRRTSMHCHPNKKTSLILLSGNANFYHDNGKIELKAVEGVVIGEGVFHSTEAYNPLPIQPVSENGIWVMEIESPPAKNDLVRMEDAYGRAGASYEGVDNMVFEPHHCLKFDEPEPGDIIEKKFFDCEFTIRKGLDRNNKNLPSPNALVSIIGYDDKIKEENPYIKAGELYSFADFYEKTKDYDLGNCLIMTVERANMLVKVSDYIFSYIAGMGVTDVFAVNGGGAMHLVDSVGTNKKLKYIAVHHEQAAAMAAEAHSRITGKPGVALVTSGPGGTNALTGLCGAWIDSIPMIVVSGQVTSDTLIGETGLRQFGVQESNIVEIVKSVTKYAVTVTDPNMIRFHVEKAAYLATTGRPGPVWLDIPLDIQSKMVDINELVSFIPETPEVDIKGTLSSQVAECIELIKSAKRPVIISGYGIRLAGAVEEFKELVEKLEIPIISSWTSSDLVSTDHKFYIGRSGIMGERAGNYAVQNSDLLLIIGSRMSIPQVGYNYNTFAREAKKIVVDIDDVELNKPSLKPDLPILADAKDFINELMSQWDNQNIQTNFSEWIYKCHYWKNKYPVVLPEYENYENYVNSFYFVDVLSSKLDENAVVVTDMGTSFTCTMQTFKVKQGQRLFTSSGHASMGFGLPGMIGACIGNGRKKLIGISGDGGLQMNIQELQTMFHYKLPIILFVLNNRGYLTIKLMQQNHFGRYVGSDAASGLSCPDIVKLAAAYGIPADRISNNNELHSKIDSILEQPGPFICEIMMPEDQPLIPRVASMKKPDGSIVSRPLEDLYPFLSREEYNENMIVKTIEILGM